MTIRPASEDDVPYLVELNGIKDEAYFRGVIKEMHRGESVLLVAVDDDNYIVGAVVLKYYGTRFQNYPAIQDLRVLERVRGQGIGSELIAVCEHLAALRGYNVIGISVNPILNSRARRLYERLGYVLESKTPYLDGYVDGQENWVVNLVKRLNSVC